MAVFNCHLSKNLFLYSCNDSTSMSANKSDITINGKGWAEELPVCGFLSNMAINNILFSPYFCYLWDNLKGKFKTLFVLIIVPGSDLLHDL